MQKRFVNCENCQGIIPLEDEVCVHCGKDNYATPFSEFKKKVGKFIRNLIFLSAFCIIVFGPKEEPFLKYLIAIMIIFFYYLFHYFVRLEGKEPSIQILEEGQRPDNSELYL